VTPFESWYSSTVEPQLTKTVQHLPIQTIAALSKASKEQMAACWNAALDEAMKCSVMYDDVSHVSGVMVLECEIDNLKTEPDPEQQLIREHHRSKKAVKP
jgi:hypothetical protein